MISDQEKNQDDPKIQSHVELPNYIKFGNLNTEKIEINYNVLELQIRIVI